MIILQSSGDSLEIVLNGAVTTTELPFYASWVDAKFVTDTRYAETNTTTNGATVVTAVASPGLDTNRTIKYISIVNSDTASAVITIRINSSGSTRNLCKYTLAVGDTIQYNDGNGFTCTNSSGEAKVTVPAISGTNLSIANKTATTFDILSSSGTGATLPQASTTEAGLLIATDKVKLNNTSGTNTGDQTITLTGDVTGSGTGTFAATAAATIVKTVVLNTAGVIYATPVTFVTAANTATGTMALATQTANFVFVGPTTGAAATPTFRALVAADLPSLSGTYVPVGRTLTINGSTQDLSANRTWTVGDALVANPLSQFAATTSAQLAGVISDETGSGSLVFATSPTLVTPVLGVATATTINKVTITAPASSATITLADGTTTAFTGGGTLALAGFTLTAPATGTAVIGGGSGSSSRIATWSDANTLTSSSSFTRSSTGTIVNSASLGGAMPFTHTNTSAGTTSLSSIVVDNNTYNQSMKQYGTGFTTVGLLVANLSTYQSTSVVGTLFANTAASTKFWFAVAGTAATNEVVQIAGAGAAFNGNTSTTKLAAPTAYIHAAAGLAAASGAPMKYTSGVAAQTALEAGAVNYDGTNLYLSDATLNYIQVKVLVATATLDFPNTLAQTDSDLTVTVTGAALSDEVVLGVPNGSTQTGSCFSAWVSSANTVTVRFSVYGITAKDPASGSFKVSVIKR